MPDPSRDALRYITPPEKAFWRWSRDGTAVEWYDGTTIAFAPELIAVIERLAPDGLPPFDLLLLVLAACRDSWGDESVTQSPVSGARTTRLGLLAEVLAPHARGGAVQWIQDSLSALDGVHRLNSSVLTDLRIKSELADLVFEFHPLRAKSIDARELCGWIRAGVTADLLDGVRQPDKTAGERIRDLRGLYDGLQRVDEETVRVRCATGLDRVVLPVRPEPDEPEEPASPTVRQLLESLEQEEQFRGLVRLTRNLMAVVHLPRPVTDPDEMSLGGVSDITNRGPLDRLLVSELAHDNDTLTVRVALNEALYLRRERPPSTPPRQRVLLLDSGLRMWGVPRVYAAAVALSMAAVAVGRADVRAFRAAGAAVAPIDLATRDGLIAHLAVLAPQVHPGESLPALREELDGRESDVVVITGADVLGDPEFRRQLADSGLAPLYLAVLGRDGRFQLLTRTGRGQKLVREAVLDLAELQEQRPERPAAPLVDQSVDAQLPAILRLKQFPLRLSHPVDPARAFVVPEGDLKGLAITVAHDRRLMLWDEPGEGALQLTDALPPGRPHYWWWSRAKELAYCVIGRGDLSGLHVVRANPHLRHCAVKELESEDSATPGALSVCTHAGGLFVVRKDRVEVFDPDTGRLRNKVPLRFMRWVRGRYFRGRNGWYALSHDGTEARWERVASHVFKDIETLIECQTQEGVVAVYSDGSVSVPSTGLSVRHTVRHGLTTPIRVSAVSRDGSSFVLSGSAAAVAPGEPKGPQCLVRWHPTICVQPCYGNPERMVHPPVGNLHQQSLRVRLRAASSSPKHPLALLTSKGRWRTIDGGMSWAPTRHHLAATPSAATEELGPLCRSFKPMPGPAGAGYSLQCAEWADGSRAILDSRGLLHLQSSDQDIPECTLVLCDQDVAGWCADGRVWGSEYFLGKKVRATSADEIIKSVLIPFASRLE